MSETSSSLMSLSSKKLLNKKFGRERIVKSNMVSFTWATSKGLYVITLLFPFSPTCGPCLCIWGGVGGLGGIHIRACRYLEHSYRPNCHSFNMFLCDHCNRLLSSESFSFNGRGLPHCQGEYILFCASLWGPVEIAWLVTDYISSTWNVLHMTRVHCQNGCPHFLNTLIFWW